MSFGGLRLNQLTTAVTAELETLQSTKKKVPVASGVPRSCSTKTARISCALNSFLLEDIDSIFYSQHQ